MTIGCGGWWRTATVGGCDVEEVVGVKEVIFKPNAPIPPELMVWSSFENFDVKG
ncbi:hypothetical protein Syun_020502 [Stephania yunnanensis]|uniref:Uncharacterized protein n=1 Tax=Stephania yunnanensis TaxID=152371 RepID=A0AAP0IEB3_9MAGN